MRSLKPVGFGEEYVDFMTEVALLGRDIALGPTCKRDGCTSPRDSVSPFCAAYRIGRA